MSKFPLISLFLNIMELEGTTVLPKLTAPALAVSNAFPEESLIPPLAGSLTFSRVTFPPLSLRMLLPALFLIAAVDPNFKSF
jgi:hypothetical protein